MIASMMKEMSDQSGMVRLMSVQPRSAQSAVALKAEPIISVKEPRNGAQLLPSRLGGLCCSHICRAAKAPPRTEKTIMNRLYASIALSSGLRREAIAAVIPTSAKKNRCRMQSGQGISPTKYSRTKPIPKRPAHPRKMRRNRNV